MFAHIITYDRNDHDKDSILIQFYNASPIIVYRKSFPQRFIQLLSILEKSPYTSEDEACIRTLLSMSMQFAQDIELKKMTRFQYDIDRQCVIYDDEELATPLQTKLLELYRAGAVDLSKYEKFVAQVMMNPSKRARKELYSFLEYRSLPILDDGRFLAYKYVREDYKDVFSGKFDNHVDCVNQMLRHHVDRNKHHECSYGFHVGSYAYALGGLPVNGHLMLVAVCPEKVVSVPLDYACQKCRVCEYEVIGEDTSLRELKKPMYTKNAEDQYDFDDDSEYDSYDEMIIEAKIKQMKG